jgi:hypothetical protein
MRLTQRSRRRIVVGLLACAATAVACIDMSAPRGAASISLLLLPSPFVVRGDTMRDSAGNVAPVRVTSFNADGEPIPDIPFELFVVDTMLRAHFTLSHLLIGDKLGTVTTVGQASGVQTLTVNVPVTVRPTTLLLFPPRPPDDTLRAPLGADSASSIGRQTLSTQVKGAGDTTVQGVIVRYRITRTLPSSSTTNAAVYIGDASTPPKPMNADTADSQGLANKRQVVVLTRLLSGPVLQQPDSVVVEATASYKGAPLIGSPLKIVVPVKVTISVR